jgi:hypothetical protein
LTTTSKNPQTLKNLKRFWGINYCCIPIIFAFELIIETKKMKNPSALQQLGFRLDGGERGSRTLDTLRYTHFYTLSRRAPSATRTPHQFFTTYLKLNINCTPRARYRPAGVVFVNSGSATRTPHQFLQLT